MFRRIIIAAFLALFATSAHAASRVVVSEFRTLGTGSNSPAQIGSLPSLRNQTPLDISGGVQSSQAFGSDTTYIRVICEVQCTVKGGSGATTSDTLLPALSPEYFGVQGGATISVIAAP